MTELAKRKIHAFNFKGEASHVALVDKAANLQTVLTMKAADPEVTVSLTMKNFLKKMFGMWEEDAACLAGVLGYDSGVYDTYTKADGTYMSDEEFIAAKIDSIQLLKGEDLDKVPKSVELKVEELMKEFGDKLNSSEGSPQEEATISKTTGESDMDEVQIKKEELAAFKAQAKEVDTLKAQLKEVDTLKAQLVSMQAEKAEKAKTEMTDVVKGYTFIEEGDREATVELLLKTDDSEILLKSLEKARDAIAAATMEESGVDGGDAIEEVTLSDIEKSAALVSDILKSRKA